MDQAAECGGKNWKMKLPAVPRSGTGYLENNYAEAWSASGGLASPFYRAEAFGEGRSSLQQAAEYPGEGE